MVHESQGGAGGQHPGGSYRTNSGRPLTGGKRPAHEENLWEKIKGECRGGIRAKLRTGTTMGWGGGAGVGVLGGGGGAGVCGVFFPGFLVGSMVWGKDGFEGAKQCQALA